MTDYTALTDCELQKLYVLGDRDAQEELAGRYLQMVRACARPYFLVGGDSEDLVQEGTIGLLSAMRQYDPAVGASFHTYAEHCVKMRLISAVKSASRLKHFPLNTGVSFEDIHEGNEPLPAAFHEISGHSPEDLVLARESKEELYTRLRSDLSKLESVVLDYYLEGLSYQEIGVRIHKEPKAIDNAVQRIRKKLARTIQSGENSES